MVHQPIDETGELEEHVVEDIFWEGYDDARDNYVNCPYVVGSPEYKVYQQGVQEFKDGVKPKTDK